MRALALAVLATLAAAAAATGTAAPAHQLNAEGRPLLQPSVRDTGGRTWIYEAPKDKEGAHAGRAAVVAAQCWCHQSSHAPAAAPLTLGCPLAPGAEVQWARW